MSIVADHLPFARRQQSMTEEEQKAFRLYGKLPNRKDLMANKLKVRPSEHLILLLPPSD